MARKNIKLNSDTYYRHEPRKEYYGLTWDQYLDAGCPQIPEDERD